MKILVAALILTMLQTDARKMLVDKKWYFAYTSENGAAVLIPSEALQQAKAWAQFKSDGVFFNALEGSAGKGTWTYNAKTGEITTVEKNRVRTVLKIHRITPDTLEIDDKKRIVGMVTKQPF